MSKAIVSKEETGWLQQQSLPFHAWLTLAFSAKESVYKALSHRLSIADFHDIRLTSLDADRQIFHCQVGNEMCCGQYIFEGELVFTALCQ